MNSSFLRSKKPPKIYARFNTTFKGYLLLNFVMVQKHLTAIFLLSLEFVMNSHTRLLLQTEKQLSKCKVNLYTASFAV